MLFLLNINTLIYIKLNLFRYIIKSNLLYTNRLYPSRQYSNRLHPSRQYIMLPNQKKLTMLEINKRIDSEFCFETMDALSDTQLQNDYKKSKSVIKKYTKIKSILKNYNVDLKIEQDSFINEIIMEMIPAGTKSVIRGNKFNFIVKNYIKKHLDEKIESKNLDKKRFEICFEKQCDICKISEIPDWYILDKNTNKLLIGMNQIDLWTGGQQKNRGHKYLIDNVNNNETTKIICVICNLITFKNSKPKSYKLFECGYANDTLCYLKNLKNIIDNYFDI